MSKKKSGIGIYIFLALIIVLIIVLGFLNKMTDPLQGLPNYTEIKGNFDVQEIQYDKQPLLGETSAPVKVVMFSDFKCPACKIWSEKFMDGLIRDYVDSGKIQLYFMNYAFIDRDSILAASAGEAIAKQSNEAFWKFYHLMYENQGDETKVWATQKFLLKLVEANMPEIDFELFKKDLEEGTYLFDVKEDFKTGGYFGVNGTPTFFVNGEKVPSAKYEDLKNAIDSTL
ncbi:DsbA family protein (plasmid) [Paenibacillus thiaminolyticus]|uniref:DsbA family protein n=1 Tax=Paenibacillus thiaminolyticus TaxID=49283 RepID=UPI00232DCB95|nr:thioredoxin domain-containing protein [Paenibacillus thiaminolyticus]WCF11529.1 DsbA family protein [Paenibacillus thiaminolyticus]